MRYSVIMPVYNKAPYLEAAMRSALSEPLLHELIIVDDGSTDGSADICDRLADEDARICVIHQENAGVSAARNAAIERVSGDYVFFLDGDDLICGGLFNEAEEILTEKSYDIVFFSYEKLYASGKSVRVAVPLRGAQGLEEVSHIFYRYQVDTGFFGCVSAKLVRSDIIKSERFNTNIILAEDFDYWMSIYPKANALYFSDFCSFTYLHDIANSSAHAEIHYYNQLELRIKFKLFLEKNGFDYDKDELGGLISKYKFFYIFNSGSCKKAAKLLKSEGHFPVKDFCGLAFFARLVLKLCSRDLLSVAASLIYAKKFISKIKRLFSAK